MYWETLPNGVWVIFYLFLLTTFATAVWNMVRKKMVILSILTIAVSITIPITGIFNSIGRHQGVNEFEHLVSELQQGAVWTVYIILGLLYLIAYWGLFMFKKNTLVE
ncbi:hypothetical protein [Thalassobacillus hwangdonensis]|uniref:Uncharacterized protein n=1 Tax=Thalassobacillus hwangdonensis TaxID=546108 RepID=A0ABW3L2V6_9BACI